MLWGDGLIKSCVMKSIKHDCNQRLTMQFKEWLSWLRLRLSWKNQIRYAFFTFGTFERECISFVMLRPWALHLFCKLNFSNEYQIRVDKVFDAWWLSGKFASYYQLRKFRWKIMHKNVKRQLFHSFKKSYLKYDIITTN